MPIQSEKGIQMNTSCRIAALAGLIVPLCMAADVPSPSVITPLPVEGRPLAERFADPPPSARILKIIHAQQEKPDAQDKQLLWLAERGFGGFAGNVAFQGYVDDETKWPAFLRGVKMAKAAGMAMWLYDECGYPSGSARDLTLRGHPEWAARGLLIAETNVCGGTVSLPLPPGKLVLAAALPKRDGIVVLGGMKDLASSVSGGNLTWQAPAGDWFVVAMTDDLIYEGTHAAVSLAYKKPCIDLLTPEPTARFLEVTHDRYAEKLGKDLGEYFTSTFTDEPSLMNLWMRPMPYRVLPWSLTIEQEFKKRCGRDLRPLLPALVAEAGPVGALIRYEFWNMVGNLVSENFFGQIQTWCRKHGLASGGHLLMEESLVGHVPLYGDFFRCVRRLDAPSIDCLTSIPSHVPWHIARLISSVADLEGRRYTMCEVSDHSQRYRKEDDKRPVYIVSEDEIRGTCNRLIWGGINTLTSYYAFKDLTDDQLRRLNLHIGRCSTMMAGGHQVADIAVLYPIESIWPKFVPAFHGATSEAAARRVENIFDGVSATLYGASRDFTYVDSRALCDARVKGDVLKYGDLSWRVLVLPAVDTMPLEAWENVEKFWRKGGIVVAIGATPSNSEKELPSARVQTIGSTLFGAGDAPCIMTNKAGGLGIFLPAGMIGLVPQMIDSLLERDVACVDAKAPVKITHRRIDGHDVFLAINDGAEEWNGEIRFCGEGVEEQWDPVVGTMKKLSDGTKVAVKLGPYGAMLFRGNKTGVPAKLNGKVESNLKMTCSPLPALKPTVGQGQHVQSELSGDNERGWCADATLKKGQVDVFLFMAFKYAEPLDLRNSIGLMLDSFVPTGQKTPAELLVFICTKDGGEYITGIGRYLNVPGPSRAYALFNQFKPFGKTSGSMDLSKVTSIRVGWGGYMGVEGEKIVLTVKPPQLFSCGAK